MDKSGRHAVVTGANSGMGLAASAALAQRGFRVTMVCRSRERGEQALKEAISLSGSEELELMLCDLGSLRSIRAFAADFRAKYDKLDVLLNNAGVFALKRELTEDGFESMMGVNHLGHFLLTHLLLKPLLQGPQGRIVVVSSGAHRAGKIHWDDPFLSRGFNFWKGYAQSKLANVLFTKELARRLAGSGATANCLHPGAVATSIGVDRRTGFGRSVLRMLKPVFLTPAEGASTAVYLAVSEETAGVSGEYYYKQKPAPVSRLAADPEAAGRLWAWSEKAVGLT
ncbi:SDR family oxidoreductase [Paenibacillus caseinilyticus]|nr:SDR family oxidoreductase [Paenibacillus mucilaginosus]